MSGFYKLQLCVYFFFCLVHTLPPFGSVKYLHYSTLRVVSGRKSYLVESKDKIIKKNKIKTIIEKQKLYA